MYIVTNTDMLVLMNVFFFIIIPPPDFYLFICIPIILPGVQQVKNKITLIHNNKHQFNKTYKPKINSQHQNQQFTEYCTMSLTIF